MKEVMLAIRDVVLITVVIQLFAFTFIKTFQELSTVQPNLQKIMERK